MISSFENGGYSIFESDSIIGFEIQLAEFYQLLSTVDTSTAKIYARLALKSVQEGGVVTRKPELVFQVENSPSKITYLDFTSPCPPCRPPDKK